MTQDFALNGTSVNLKANITLQGQPISATLCMRVCVCVFLWERERESNSIRKINDITHWPACIQYLSIVNWCLIMDSWFTSQQLKHFWLWFWIDIRVSLTKKSSIWILKTPIRRFRLFCMSGTGCLIYFTSPLFYILSSWDNGF